MKERMTLTLDKDLIKHVDKTIDKLKVKNRSHAIELLLTKALGNHKPKKALILAGGKGTRLKPITHEIPKPLVPLQEKPIVEHTLDLLKKHNIKDIIFSIGFKGEKIKEYFGDGRRFGVNITYVEEKEPLGTAGPLRLAKDLLDDTFLMCNADEVKNIDLTDMYLFHKESGGMGTIALTSVKDPSAYGVARMKGNSITEFVEKPPKDKAPTNLINSGLYILEPEVIDFVPEGFSMVEKDVFPKIAEMGKLKGYNFEGQWFDTGTMERYEKAIKEWKGVE
ncbi:MAG: sugar phosphate nucleotidyltransferase [Nanobdellota archaeon]